MGKLPVYSKKKSDHLHPQTLGTWPLHNGRIQRTVLALALNRGIKFKVKFGKVDKCKYFIFFIIKFL